MLTAQQQSELELSGLTRVPGAFPPDAARRMCEHVWAALARRHGITQGASATWTVAEPRHLQALRQAHAFDAIASPQLLAALDEVLGADAWQRPKQWGVPLVTSPREGAGGGPAPALALRLARVRCRATHDGRGERPDRAWSGALRRFRRLTERS